MLTLMCLLAWPALIESVPVITAQDLTNLANKRLVGLRGHFISKSGGRVPHITAAIFPQSRKELLAHLSLSVAHMRRRAQSICLNLHMHILSTVWSYGSARQSLLQTYVPSKRTGSWVCHPSCSLYVFHHHCYPILREVTHIQRQSWKRTHTHTHTYIYIYINFIWIALREPSRSGPCCS